MFDTELRRKVAWLITVRAIIGSALLGSATFMHVAAPTHGSVDPFFVLIGLLYALTLVYALVLKQVDERRWLIDLQLVGDAVIVSVFIYFTGGVASYFASLYALPIAAGSVVRFRRGALLVAMLSAVLYVQIVAGQYMPATSVMSHAWMSGQAVGLPQTSVAVFISVLNVLGFFAIALLSGSLAEGVRTRGAQLEKASSQIADLQALNQHVIDSLSSGLATTDVELRILTFNRGAETITGVPFPSAVGQRIDEVLQLSWPTIEEIRSDLRRVGTRRHEFKYRRTEGRGDIEIGLGVTHLETPGGRAGYLFTFQDVTTTKKLERDAAIQQRLAAIGQMAAGIAHEIRNPLASMSGSIQILRQDLPLTSEQEQLMDIVLRESDRLNTTIRSFLDYARPQRFAVERFDIRRALSDTALLLRNSSDLHEQHAIVVDVPESELWYDADEGQIKQVVWNLATNGLRAMPDGGHLRLGAAAEPSAGWIVLTVVDEGAGIPQREISELFQPFHGSFAKGSGLGLAIVHRIVADYGGTIEFRSVAGKGTTVAVRLPARSVVAA